jgi:hypothetical protein
MNRDRWAAIVSATVVLAVVILGLTVTGGPGTQRLVQSDLRTVRAMGELAQQIKFKWNSSGNTLPMDLQSFPESTRQNPVTHKSFIYRLKSSGEYELCTTFQTDSSEVRGKDVGDFWVHAKGDQCFQFDASQQVPQIPYY